MIPRHPTAIAIVARVAAIYGVSPDLLWKEQQKRPTLAEARHVAFWKAWKDTGWSPGETAEAMMVDRTSILHGVRKVEGHLVNGTGTAFLRNAVQLLRIPWIGCWQKVDERVARQLAYGGQTDEQDGDRDGSVQGLPPTPPLQLDQVSDQDPESSSLLSSDQRPVSKRARGGGKSARWRFVPTDWAPTDAHRALASTLRLDLAEQEKLFREHEFKDPKSDADRAFSRWLRKAPEFAPRQPNGKPPGLTLHEQYGVPINADKAQSILAAARREQKS